MAKLEQSKLTGDAANRVQRYRLRNRRIDFYPSPDVADIIAHHLATGSEKCVAGILDGLIRVGHRTVSGNAGQA